MRFNPNLYNCGKVRLGFSRTTKNPIWPGLPLSAGHLGGGSRRGLERWDLDHHSSEFTIRCTRLLRWIHHWFCLWWCPPPTRCWSPSRAWSSAPSRITTSQALSEAMAQLKVKSCFKQWSMAQIKVDSFNALSSEMAKYLMPANLRTSHWSKQKTLSQHLMKLLCRKRRVKPLQWGGFQELSQVCNLGPGEWVLQC